MRSHIQLYLGPHRWRVSISVVNQFWVPFLSLDHHYKHTNFTSCVALLGTARLLEPWSKGHCGVLDTWHTHVTLSHAHREEGEKKTGFDNYFDVRDVKWRKILLFWRVNPWLCKWITNRGKKKKALNIFPLSFCLLLTPDPRKDGQRLWYILILFESSHVSSDCVNGQSWCLLGFCRYYY